MRGTIPLALVALAVLAASCTSKKDDAPAYPSRDCSYVLWVKAEPTDDVRLFTSWSGWKPTGTPIPLAEQVGWRMVRLRPPTGEQGYYVTVNGKPQLDEHNPLTTYRDEQEVSLLLVEDCSKPEVRVDSVAVDGDNIATIRGTFLAATDGKAMDPSTLTAKLGDGTTIAPVAATPGDGAFEFRSRPLPRGKHTFTLEGGDQGGQWAPREKAIAWAQPVAATWNDVLIYQIMIDRYRDKDGAALMAPTTPGSRAGGSLDGIRAAIETGYFDELGVGALWLSPVYLTPKESREGRDGHMYEGYHGYWPLDSLGVEPRIGGEQALVKLVDAAHSRGIRVLLDVVPNHVYETNPIYQQHTTDGWFHTGKEKCVCGDAGCGWNTHIELCWFTAYLPDYRFQHPDSMRLAVNQTAWWVDQFDTDGVRIDAVPMMPRATTRRIAHGLRSSRSPRDSLLVLGEIYTGAGEGGIASIQYFMGPDGLDSAFDFPLLWTMREVIGAKKRGFSAIDDSVVQMEAALQGSGAVMGRIVGNHDTERFLSVAQGDYANDPWSNPPIQPTDAAPYAKLRMALTIVLTLPGAPIIYYGDELGLAGGGDPDDRRVMPLESSLSDLQKQVLDHTRRLGRLRRCSDSLRRGTRTTLQVSDDVYAYERRGNDDPVYVVLSRASFPVGVTIPPAKLPFGRYVDVASGEQVSIGVDGAPESVSMPGLSARVLVPEQSSCAK